MVVDDAVWMAQKACWKAKVEWEEAVLLMTELKLKPQLLALKAWLWAASTISSRTMHIPWDDAGCLCPLGDFFNYAAPSDEYNSENLKSHMKATFSHTTSFRSAEELPLPAEQRLIDAGYNEDVAAYCFYARRNYEKGEQVLLTYGTYTNLELLEYYGFILKENPNDKAFIPLEPEMYSMCSWPSEFLYIDEDGKPSFALLSAVRLWSTPSNKRKSVGHLVYSGNQLSAENEMRVMQWIAMKCKFTLNNLSTSGEEDELLLSTIDVVLNSHASVELVEVPLDFRGLFSAFLESTKINTAQKRFTRKITTSMYRWKLAIQWRLKYKRTLSNCITHCNDTILGLSPDGIELR